MLRSRVGAALVMSMTLALAGCPRATVSTHVVALVQPTYNQSHGYDVQQVAVPGQTLEWRTKLPLTKEFWVVFPNANPCEGQPDFLYGTPDKPAQCKVAAQPAGQFVQYSYVILDHKPKKLHSDDGVTPCGGCDYLVGSDVVSSMPVAPGPDTPAIAPEREATLGTSIRMQDPAQIDLNCAGSGPIKVDPPSKQPTTTFIYWQATSLDLDHWQAVIRDPVSPQVPLCTNGKTFSKDLFYCNLNAKASGTYTYDVTSAGSKCSASNGNIVLR